MLSSKEAEFGNPNLASYHFIIFIFKMRHGLKMEANWLSFFNFRKA